MLIDFKDLQVGDEIIVPHLLTFRYLKVLSLPKKPDSTIFRCSTYKETITSSKWGPYTIRKLETDSTKHNCKESVDLGYRSVWLVKREL